MPIVAHNALPTFERLREEGVNVLPPDRALHQDIRELHIGLLNMMPDKALAATERQFFRLVGESNPIAQFYMHPFTLPELVRGEAARAHVEQYYDTFEQLREQGLDALIITASRSGSR
jgi:homoserine O-succinyltransferase